MDIARRRYQLGLFVIASAALLAVLAVFFGGAPRFLQQRTHYTILFDDAPGVVKGTPVRKSGVRIGEVDTVELDDDNGVVRVRIAIDPRYSIRANEEPVIVPDLLSRDTTIDFMPVATPRTTPPSALPPPVPVPKSGAGRIIPASYEVAQAEPGLAPLPGQVVAPGQVLPPGSEIKGRAPPDVRQLVREASDMLPSAQASLAQITSSVKRFEALAPTIERTLNEYSELARSIREVVPEIRHVLGQVKGLDTSVRKTLDEVQDTVRVFKSVGERVDVLVQTNQNDLDRIIRNTSEATQRIVALLNDENQKNFASALRSVTTAARSFEDISKVLSTRTLPQVQDTLSKLDGVLLNVAQLTKPFADRADRIARNVDSALESTSKFAGSFGDTLGGLGKADGTLQRFLNDPSVFNNLNDASLMLARLLPKVDRILKDFEVFADKLARHPELIGVGGAVNPSAGLKEGTGAAYKPRN